MFYITDICKYTLRRQKYLYPCQTGEHLQDCTNFQCSTMFKCPNQFCIPWGYICDGKWDCPDGTDESENTFCSVKWRNCTNLFRCRSSQTCVHFTDLCNKIVDCPQADDESLCSLKFVLCPPYCEYLTFAVMCHGREAPVGHEFMNYRIILMENAKITGTVSLLYSLIGLSIKASLLSGSICDITSQSPFLVYIKVPYNQISFLSKNCFANSQLLITILLDNNNLVTLSRRVFGGLKQLKCLSISHNPIIHIWPDSSSDLSGLKVISLLNLSKYEAQQKLFATTDLVYLEASDYHHCCLSQIELKCAADRPWYFSCFASFTVSEHKAIMMGISFLIVISNIGSLALQSHSFSKTTVTKKLFGVQVVVINLQDILCALSFILLLLADSLQKRNSFVLNKNWNPSLWCWIICFLNLFVMFSSYLNLSFLAFMRLNVVTHPLEMKCIYPSHSVTRIHSFLHACPFW